MRYYKIAISDPKTGQIIQPNGFQGKLGDATYTSFVNGKSLPGAWNVELDIPVIGAATPNGSALARVWGISNQEIGQANDLRGKNIKIFGGMQAGLPLANPAQSGLLVSGMIFQCFGNAIGTDRTLDFVIVPGQTMGETPGGIGSIAAPRNLTLNWLKNTPLAGALKTTLETAFPGSKITISIDPGIVRSNDEVGFFPTLEQLAAYCRDSSRAIIKKDNYAGVSITPAPNGIVVSDRSQESSAKNRQILFQDLIGQPTWIESPNIQFKTVMRADLTIDTKVFLPKSQTTNSQAALSALVNQAVSFQGGFSIVSVRHIGNFRQPSADSWVTVFDGAPQPESVQSN